MKCALKRKQGIEHSSIKNCADENVLSRVVVQSQGSNDNIKIDAI